MQHYNLFRSARGLIAGMSVCVSACFVSSCTDDTFNQHRATGPLLFDVEVPADWSSGPTRVDDENISIRKMSESAGDKPLYLVTEITDADATASEAVTRGTPVTEKNFPASFGLSAICYTGDWSDTDAANWPVNFAYNLKVEKGATSWHVADDKKLNWVGSGSIRFFAYSPYSTDEAAHGSIAHSLQNTPGIPTLTYEVPGSTANQPDLMVATATCGGNGSGADINASGQVALKFKHVLTAINVKAGENMLAGKITKVSISGVYGKGSLKIGSDKWDTTGNSANATFTAEPKEAIDLPQDKGDNDKNLNTKPDTDIIKDNEYTFMMIPQTLPDGAKLMVEFTDSLTNTSRKLTAELKGTVWPMGKKVTYSISSSGIQIKPLINITIDRAGTYPAQMLPMSGYLHNVGLEAYAQVVQVGHDTKRVPLSGFTVQYSTNEGASWTDAGAANGYGWEPKQPATQEELLKELAAGKAVAGSLTLPAQPAFTQLRSTFTITNDKKGTEKNPYDLVENNPVAQESANCYIVNAHGYYTFPLCYGNAINKKGYKPYEYNGTASPIPIEVLPNLVDYQNNPITSSEIKGAQDAVIVWQDSPDLVTDVKLNDAKDAVIFHIPRQTLNQGNAIIAVRDEHGIIMWSWHIWATHYDWFNKANLTQFTAIVTDTETGHGNTHFLAPCNLGYCDHRNASPVRSVRMCFEVTMPDGKSVPVTEEGGILITSMNAKEAMASTISTENKEKVEKGIITFTQEEVIESVAGDNPYYQWGRKDPMLPGIYNQKTIDAAHSRYSADKDSVKFITQFDMQNKTFYSTKEYTFWAAKSGVSIGRAIQEPHHFFMSPSTKKLEGNGKDTHEDSISDYLRRHWHDGEKVRYRKKAIMNFWNLHHDIKCKSNKVDKPNGDRTIKTVYDPCPAGYKVPEPNVFSLFAKHANSHYTNEIENVPGISFRQSGNIRIGWEISLYEISGTDTIFSGKKVFFPATGLRDMGLTASKRDTTYGSWPAHSVLTFVATSGFQGNNTGSSSLLFALDNRTNKESVMVGSQKVALAGGLGISMNIGTNNAYGFTVRPILDE